MRSHLKQSNKRYQEKTQIWEPVFLSNFPKCSPLANTITCCSFEIHRKFLCCFLVLHLWRAMERECVVDESTTMTPVPQTYRGGKVFPGWGSEDLESLPPVHVSEFMNDWPVRAKARFFLLLAATQTASTVTSHWLTPPVLFLINQLSSLHQEAQPTWSQLFSVCACHFFITGTPQLPGPSCTGHIYSFNKEVITFLFLIKMSFHPFFSYVSKI